MPHDPPRPAVLVVTHRVPYPPDKGDRIRTHHLLRFLWGRAAVHVACLADEPVSAATTAYLRERCARFAAVPLGRSRWLRAASSLAAGGTASTGAFHSPALARLLEGWAAGTRFHAAVASASSAAPYLRLPGLRRVPAVVDLMDVDSAKWADYAAASAGPKAWLYALEARRLARLERDICGWARAVTLVSEAEADLLRARVGGGAVRAVTCGVDHDHFRPSGASGGGAGCVFVGALDYRPNVDGAVWFCAEVWPRLRERAPGARLRLVGRRPVPAVRRLAAVPGVEVVGQVPDVRPYLAEAAVAVAPLRLGRGLQNKVLEALAAGKPVVASPQALAGFGVRPDLPVVCATTAEDWAGQLARLLGDAAARRELGAAGRRFAETHHDWDECLKPFAGLLRLDDVPPTSDTEPALSTGEAARG